MISKKWLTYIIYNKANYRCIYIDIITLSLVDSTRISMNFMNKL